MRRRTGRRLLALGFRRLYPGNLRRQPLRHFGNSLAEDFSEPHE